VSAASSNGTALRLSISPCVPQADHRRDALGGEIAQRLLARLASDIGGANVSDDGLETRRGQLLGEFDGVLREGRRGKRRGLRQRGRRSAWVSPDGVARNRDQAVPGLAEWAKRTGSR